MVGGGCEALAPPPLFSKDKFLINNEIKKNIEQFCIPIICFIKLFKHISTNV